MPGLRKSVKGKLILSQQQHHHETKSSSKLSLLSIEFEHLLNWSCSGTMLTTSLSLVTVIPFVHHLKLFYVLAFVVIAHVIGLPLISFMIITGNLYELYFEPKFKKFLDGKNVQQEQIAVSILFDSLNNREEVIDQVHQFVKFQIDTGDFDSKPSISENLLLNVQNCDRQARNVGKSSSPLIVSFPPRRAEVVQTILQTFASLQMGTTKKEKDNLVSENDLISTVSEHVTLLTTFVFSMLPLTEDLKKKIVEVVDVMEIPKMVQVVVSLARKMVMNIQSASIVVRKAVEKWLVSAQQPFHDIEPESNVDLTRGFCDPFPRDLLDLVKDKTQMSSEALILSILSGAFSSYFRLMRGEAFDHVNVSYGEWDGAKASIELPLKSPSITDENLFLIKISKLKSKAKEVSKNLEQNLSLLKMSLPTNWCEQVTDLLAEDDKSEIEIQNLYLNSDANHHPLGNPLVKSVYLWSEVANKPGKAAKFRIFVIHRDEGITLTLSGIKNDPIESASLLAECIVKSVANLCYNLGIKRDRRSPPSTPNQPSDTL